jgi:glyoxylase-like metal-dependent hydrolase (beta-lactamase superfamily II)
VYYEPTTGALFAGDLVSNRFTPALLEEHTCGWLGNLHLLPKRFPDARTIYPGHGVPADARTLIDRQRAYLLRFRDLVRPAVDKSSAKGEEIDSTEQTAILGKLGRAYPNHPRVASLPTLNQVNVQAVGHELRLERPTSCRWS